jgi:hypothetical protein
LDDDNVLLRWRLGAARRRLHGYLLRAHHLLRRRLQLVVLLREATKSLDRSKHVSLLRRKRVTKLLQPCQVGVHGRQYYWKRHQGLHTCIPLLGFQRLGQCVAGERLVGWVFHPTCRCNDFERVGRGHQNLGQ